MKPRPPISVLILLAVVATIAVLTGCPVSIKKSEPIKAVASTPEEQAQTVESLRSFLAEVDEEKGESWEHLSQTLRASTSQMTWSVAIAGMKMASGKKLSRGKAHGVCTEELPNSPKGRYFIFDIDSKFERANLVERVVLTLENGQWKVAGYFRKKTFSFGDESKKP